MSDKEVLILFPVLMAIVYFAVTKLIAPRVLRWYERQEALNKARHKYRMWAFAHGNRVEGANAIPRIVAERAKASKQGARFNRFNFDAPWHGYVYLMRLGEYYKIGYAQNVQSR